MSNIERVYDYIADHPGCTTAAMANELGLTFSATYHSVRLLIGTYGAVEATEVTQHGRGGNKMFLLEVADGVKFPPKGYVPRRRSRVKKLKRIEAYGPFSTLIQQLGR